MEYRVMLSNAEFRITKAYNKLFTKFSLEIKKKIN